MTEQALQRARNADRKMTIALVKMICDTQKAQSDANTQIAKVLTAFLEIYTAAPGTPAAGWVTTDMSEFLKEKAAEADLPGFPAGALPEDQLRWLEREMDSE